MSNNEELGHMEQNEVGELELLRNRLDRAKLVLAATKVIYKFISKIESERPLDKTVDLRMIDSLFHVMDHRRMAEAIFPLDQCVYLDDHIKQEMTSQLLHTNADLEKLKKEMQGDVKFERDLYAEMVEQEPQFKEYWNRFVLESWYFMTEEEAYQHVKFDEYLKTCDAIKVDSTLDVLSKLDLSEFKDLPEALIKGGVLVCREVLRGHPNLPGEDNPIVSHDVVRAGVRKYFDTKHKELDEWWVKAAMRRFPYLKAYKRLRQENSTVGEMTCMSN